MKFSFIACIPVPVVVQLGSPILHPSLRAAPDISQAPQEGDDSPLVADIQKIRNT
jgi:hypothetical protein